MNNNNTNWVLACIDGSTLTDAVCDYDRLDSAACRCAVKIDCIALTITMRPQPQ